MSSDAFYEQLLNMLLYTVIPIVITLLLERLFIFKLARSPAMQKWSNKKFFLQPNTISRARYFMGVISVLIYHYINQPLGLYFYGFWMITDITDGSIARFLKKKSPLGEVIDPLSDKLLYFPPLFYAAFYLDILSVGLVVGFFFIDFGGQFSRKFSKVKAANLFGKAKTLLCVVTLLLVYAQAIYFKSQLFDAANFLLLGVILLALCSIIFRLIPNYWYANILSILNLFCGIVGIILIILGYPLAYAFFLVFLGQFLDLLDGRAAEKWGSTPKGEIFDDLADGTNFGLTISCMIYAAITNKWLAGLAAVVYGCCTFYRLQRFIKDKKKAQIPQGVAVFNGLPSPAGALCMGSFLIVFDDYCRYLNLNCYDIDWLNAVVALIIATLMVSHLPYIHAGRSMNRAVPRIIKVVLYTLLIIAAVIGFKMKNYIFLMSFIFSVSIAYLIFGLKFFWPKTNNGQAH